MRCAFIFVLFLFLSITWAPLTWAQNKSVTEQKPTSELYNNSYRANPQYDAMVRIAMTKKPPQFDFMRLRSLYAQTRQYDPIGDDAIKALTGFAYQTLHEKDAKKAEISLFNYQQTIASHLANLGLVMQALALAREDKRFGQVGFFEWVRDGLIKSVMNSRKGRTLDDAFAVVTLSEETVAISSLGLKLLKTVPMQESRIYYNMNEVINPRTSEKWTVFVNTSIPMRFLQLQQEDLENLRNFDIRRQ
jgi:hypothetical protein